MSFDVADAEHYRSLLETEIGRHARQRVDLLIVDDLAQWASSRDGNATGNPPAMAVADSESGRWGIVLRRAFDAERIATIVSRITNPDAFALLCTPETFLRHLVLHELAHLQNQWGQDREDDCDAWAFEKMQSNSAFERDAPRAARSSP